MKELDLLFERFVRATPLTDQDRRALETLLARPDPLLAAYLLAGEAPEEPELARLVARIRTYVA